ncbi:HPP family protein [Cesiribacter sp. SM1]|uniref:HPP family protein n=1 Tax=Cesiribacter sp. SM1 TaxID=2861196 RepID=UPI001CD49A9A|nr:HPP family protein [Cesiribacter sp. SM1]
MKQRIRKNIQLARFVFYKETLIDFKEHFWTFVGAFAGIGLIGFTQSLSFDTHDNLFLIGSFGASSVLIYGVIQSPLAQPRNLIGGHVISALVGVTISKLLPDPLWLAASLAVSLSIVLMQITKTLHPPGGATALIAIIGSAHIKSLGYFYVFSPVLCGSLILLVVALIFNNITSHRSYPVNKNWYKIWQRGYRD